MALNKSCLRSFCVLHKWSTNILYKAKQQRLNIERTIALREHCFPVEYNIVKSKYKDVNIPNESLTDFIWKNIEKWPEKTAVICGVTGEKYTYSQMRRKCLKFATSLQKLGLKKGDVLAIVLPNVPKFPIAFFGAIEAGLVIATVNPIYNSEEMKKQLLQSDVKCIVTLTHMYPTIMKAVNTVNKHPHIVTIGDDGVPRDTVKFEDLIDDHVDVSNFNKIEIDPEEVAVLLQSSGTTGSPKCVALTHRNIVANCLQCDSEPVKYTHPAVGGYQDVVNGILPFFHIYGVTVLLVNRFYDGCKVITQPKLEPESFINNMIQHKINNMFLVPPLVLFLTNHPSVTRDHLRFLKFVLCGAAPLRQGSVEQFLEKAGKNCQLSQGYGMTESIVTLLSPKGCTKYTSVGTLVPSTQVKIQDVETGELLSSNKIGEIAVKGPQVMKGYVNNPTTNEQSPDKAGWLKTGDLGYYDDDHYFYITERIKDLIKVKGFQVAPAEIEEILCNHPDVLEAAVVGVPDDKVGELPKAFVVLKKSGNATEKELQNFVANKVSEFKQLTGGVTFIDSLPKSASGKILRRQLK